MAERYIFQKNKEKRQRAGRKQIEQARGQYPKMPEHFRQMVEQAAQEGLRQTRGAERGKRSGAPAEYFFRWRQLWLLAAELWLREICG